MKVRFSTAYGDRYGKSHRPGDVVEYADHIAVKLIKARIAVPVREDAPEQAVRKPRERAALTTKAFLLGKNDE